MAEVSSFIVPEWGGIDARGKDLRTNRRSLNNPRRIENMTIDENGHLFMPRAAKLAHTFPSGEGRITQMQYLETPRGLLVQTTENNKVYHFRLPLTGQWETGDLNVTDLINLNVPNLIWAISSVGKGLFGNSTRGTGPHDGQTLEVEDWNNPTVTDISAEDLPREGQASFSTFWKGRRFVVVRGRQVWFSELNDHNNFPEDNTFRIGGDDGGNDWVTNPGFIQGMASWEDQLLFFLNSSVWMMSGGGDPNTWQLRDTLSTMGTIGGAWTLASTQYGVFSLGGQNQGDRSVYLFNGGTSEKVSEPVDNFIGGQVRATQQFGYYILSIGTDSEAHLQFLLFDILRRRWSAFTGYRYGVATPTPHGFFISDLNNLYHIEAGSRKSFPRKPGLNAKVTMGWEDERHPNKLTRFLGVKLSGKKSGGTPTVAITARLPNGESLTTGAQSLTEDTFDGLLLPLNFRGPAVEFDLEIVPDTDEDEVVIESLELMHSRKGEKLSRV